MTQPPEAMINAGECLAMEAIVLQPGMQVEVWPIEDGSGYAVEEGADAELDG